MMNERGSDEVEEVAEGYPTGFIAGQKVGGGSYSNHGRGQEAEPKWFYLRVMTF